jgi:hypothetical protein
MKNLSAAIFKIIITTIGMILFASLVFPIGGSIITGVVILTWQSLNWLGTAVWHPLALRDAIIWWIGRTIYDGDLATGLLGIDKMVLWSVDQVPLTLWLIVILPIVWGVTWNAIFSRIGYIRRELNP